MALLSSLTFTIIPQQLAHNPKLIRRQRLIDRLEEQKRLAADPSFVPVEKRWKKTADGSRTIVDHYRRIKPWWKADPNGNFVLIVRSGLKTIEFEKGKPGIVVGPRDKLESVIETFLAAAKAGELDRLLESPSWVEQQLASKVKKIA